jgi:predicted 2-oxoglutarate/Fe(II)-dependent dioxygenase YbiX
MDVLIPGTDRPYLDGDSLDLSAPLVFTVPGVLTVGDCQMLIEMLEKAGFDDAPISTIAGTVMRPEIRNNTRCMFDHEDLAGRLYARVAGSLPIVCKTSPVGANERFRAYRYEPGQRFAPHLDGCFKRNAHERSELTLMVYLNDGFGGGATRFLDYEIDVVPKTGMALLFQHRILHEGCPVTSGVKYVLRSDIMYRDPSPGNLATPAKA